MVIVMRVTAPGTRPSWFLPPRPVDGITKTIERLQIALPLRAAMLLGPPVVIPVAFPLVPRRRRISITMQHIVVETAFMMISIVGRAGPVTPVTIAIVA
jgi:hypothetical protein